MHTEYETYKIFLQIVQLIAHIILLCFLIALYRKLPKRTLTIDDPTGEKKQKIFDSLTKAIEDVKSTV